MREREVRHVYIQPPQPMYECVSEDGDRYTSDNNEGNPRWVPYWSAGYPAWPRDRHTGSASVSGNVSIGNGTLSFQSGDPRPPRPPHPPRPGHGGAGSPIPRLAVAEIEPAIAVQGEIEQTPLTRGGEGRQAGDHMAVAARIDAQQAPRALADEVAAIRQQDQPPGMIETLHQGSQCQRPHREHQADKQQGKQSQHGGILARPDLNVAEV